MQALDLPIADGFLIRSDYPDGEIDRILRSWEAAPPETRPTAVIVVADSIAIAVLRAAERHGFRIGETLSVVGFDGVPIGQIIRPALTTLRQPMQTISQALLDLLQAGLNGSAGEPATRLIKPELVIRESSGAPQAD